jgi:hypothetical protein
MLQFAPVRALQKSDTLFIEPSHHDPEIEVHYQKDIIQDLSSHSHADILGPISCIFAKTRGKMGMH